MKAEHICVICKKNFKSKNTLNNHFSRIHTQKGKVYCRKCGILFNSLSEMRKHAWAEHRDMYKYRKRSPETIAKYKATRAANKIMKTQAIMVQSNGSPKPELTAFELLQKLKVQRNFMVDVVNLIEGMLNQ